MLKNKSTGIEKSQLNRKNLEDYELGATQAEVLAALKKVTNPPQAFSEAR